MFVQRGDIFYFGVLAPRTNNPPPSFMWVPFGADIPVLPIKDLRALVYSSLSSPRRVDMSIANAGCCIDPPLAAEKHHPERPLDRFSSRPMCPVR